MADPTRTGVGHDGHDPLAIAAYASADGSVEAAIGARLAVGCTDCAALAADLRSIVGATAILHAVPIVAPRDFRLSEADARRLSRRRWFASPVGPSSDRGARRLQGLGAAVAALGLAGLAFAAIGPTGPIQTAADAFTGTREGPAVGGASYDPAPAIGPVASEELAIQNDDVSKAATAPEAGEARAALGAVSGAAVVAGLGLALLGRTRRRST